MIHLSMLLNLEVSSLDFNDVSADRAFLVIDFLLIFLIRRKEKISLVCQ